MANPSASLPAQPPPPPRSPGTGASTHAPVSLFPSAATVPEPTLPRTSSSVASQPSFCPDASPPSTSFVADPPPPLDSGLMGASSSTVAASTTAEVNRRMAEAETAQGSMASAYHSLFRDISPCVVLVQQVGRIEYFCVGSVIQSEDESTFILTQSSILKSYSAASLTVCFSDGSEQPASVVSRNDMFCILKTSFHPKCKVLQLFEGEIDHTYAAAIAPSSPSSASNIPGFILQKSYLVSDDVPGIHLREKHFFVFACQYGDSCPNGKSRLISGPVFSMDGKVLGFVFKDLHYRHYPKGETVDPDFYVEQGFNLKVCLASSHLDEMLGSMVGAVDWREELKSLDHTG